MLDTSRIETIRNKSARFDFGKTKDIAATVRFLLETIDQLIKVRDAALSLSNQLEASTVEQESSDYRILKGESGVVCRKSTLAGLQAALR